MSHGSGADAKVCTWGPSACTWNPGEVVLGVATASGGAGVPPSKQQDDSAASQEQELRGLTYVWVPRAQPGSSCGGNTVTFESSET